MMNKKVSVIIPFYNGVNWLYDAVQSVLDQTYRNIEIIVINDGSVESVDEFLRIYGTQVKYHYQENQGPAVARNYGLSIASGDYIAYLDSDDVWLPQKLEKQITFMEENHFMWSHTGFYYWWPNSNRIKQINNQYDYGDIRRQMRISFKMVTPSVIVHRDTLIEHPEIIFPPQLRKGQDTAYFHHLANYYNVALVKEPLVKIRMRGDNSNSQVLMRFDKKNDMYEQSKKKPKEFYRFEKFILCIYAFYHKLFGLNRNPYKEFIAKCFWVIPFLLERIYVRYIINTEHKDNRYILK